MSERKKGTKRSAADASSEAAAENNGNEDRPKKKIRKFSHRRNFRNKKKSAHSTPAISIPLLNPLKTKDSTELPCISSDMPTYLKFYLPKTDLKPESSVLSLIKILEDYFERNIESYKEQAETILETRTFDLDYQKLLKDTKLKEDFKDFSRQIRTNPTGTLAICGFALHHTLRKYIPTKEVDVEPLKPKLQNYFPVVEIQEAERHVNLSQLMSIRGTVMRANATKFLLLWSCYVCKKCKAKQLVYQIDGKIHLPSTCHVKKCRSKKRNKFQIDTESPYCIIEPVQEMQIQKTDYDKKEESEAKFLRVVLKYDLVNQLMPGDDIVVTGICRNGADGNKFFDAISFTHQNSESMLPSISQNIELMPEDVQEAEKIKSCASPFRLLVNSLRPDLHQVEMVKAGLILSLFSGNIERRKCLNARENIHILMVGDPGKGKSELLNACCTVATKGVYCITTHLSKTGLLGHAQKIKGQVVVSGGALVSAHGGVCCIDEMDKQTKMHTDLLDGMERQKINIARNGINVTMKCRTTVLAAANPVDGIYNRSKSVVENIRVHPALISRFDLVYIVVSQESLQKLSRSRQEKTAEIDENAKLVFGEKKFAVEEFLRRGKNEQMELLSDDQIRNYIKYVRKRVFPKMSPEAMAKLTEFYMELRHKLSKFEIFDVTPRQFYGLCRLAFARARVDSSEKVTLQHANDVIELTRYCMIDIFTTEDGKLEARGVQGSGMSKANQKLFFLEQLQKFRTEKGQHTFNMDQLKKVKEHLKLDLDVHEIVDSLNLQGHLLMVQPNVYRIVSS
ncbi:DNA helicase MCM8 [Culicoides brevitarsis]|uniref:DNA helicase MCM8 n=1 Tax=Culicoides brevitarsis TaxID=469753 RepID=UPI00307B5AB8